VACGVRFSPINSLKIPHYGLFWKDVYDDFPTSQHASPLGDLSERIEPSGFPLPRVWLVSQSENTLLQLQNDRILFNWRRIGDDDEYPRFEYVYESFNKYAELFQEFLESNDLGQIEPVECELTYINHIVEGEGWQTAAEIGQIMRDVIWTSDKEILPEPETINWQGTFRFPDDKGSLNVTLRQGIRKTDNKKLFMLEFNAKGIEQNKSLHELKSWYEMAHEWIVKGFADLTSSEIQAKLWKRK